jgi:prepilin-type processing-associated H-X9-DG protein
MGFIAKHDGTSTTIMLGENRDATVWHIASTNTAPTQDAMGIVWQDLTTVTPALNQGVGTIVAGSASSTSTNNPARPSSNHPGGFNLTFCDGHVQFISQDIQYQVYAVLMTPWGANCRTPGNAAYTGAASPTQYSGGVPVVVTQQMLNP